MVNSCSLSCVFTYRALPPLCGSRPDVGSTPTGSRAPIPRTALSGLTAGLRQRGLLGAFNPFAGCFYIHAAQRSPLSYSSRSSPRVAQLRPCRALSKIVARSACISMTWGAYTRRNAPCECELRFQSMCVLLWRTQPDYVPLLHPHTCLCAHDAAKSRLVVIPLG